MARPRVLRISSYRSHHERLTRSLPHGNDSDNNNSHNETVEFGLELQDATITSTEHHPSRSSNTHTDDLEPRGANADSEIETQQLPPTDRGKAAWLMLAACSVIQVPVWGFSLAFGVFQEYYSSHDELIKGKNGNIAIIGTTSTGILYLLSPITFTLLTRYPHFRRYCAPLGLFLALAGFVLSSFANEVWQLIATQGVLCAIGNGLLFSPSTLYLDEWFVQRKGLALGIMWSAKSIAGVVLPFVADACLESVGVKNTLRGWAAFVLLSTLPILKYIKPRTPIPASTTARRLDLSFLRLTTFWMLQAGNILQSLGYFLPSTYLPSYSTQTLGLSRTTGILMVSLFNATSIIGGIVLGHLCDRFAVTNIMLVSSVGSALSVLLFWGLSFSSSSSTRTNTTSTPTNADVAAIALLTIFAITYGFFAGGFSSTWSGILTQMKRESPYLETGLVFGLLAGGRGIGNVVSGPLSTALIQSEYGNRNGHGHNQNGYETGYRFLIIFTGITALLGAWSWMWKVVRSVMACVGTVLFD